MYDEHPELATISPTKPFAAAKALDVPDVALVQKGL